jgi:hypothetical protein
MGRVQRYFLSRISIWLFQETELKKTPNELDKVHMCWLLDWLLMMGWDWRLRTAVITGLLFIPRVNVSGEPWWWWGRLGIPPDSSTRALWHFYEQKHLQRVGGMDGGMRILRIQYLWYVNGSFACRKILRHRPSGFTSYPKESVLRIFIALKNPSPRPVLNPQPLGPVASKLTTTPPRRPSTYETPEERNVKDSSDFENSK